MRIALQINSRSKFGFDVVASNSAPSSSIFSRAVTWTLVLFSWTIVIADATYNPYQPQVIFEMSLFLAYSP